MPNVRTTARPKALITGGSRGIGRASAFALAQAGYDVAVTSTRLESLQPVVAELRALGAAALALELDVRSQSSIEHAFATLIADFGDLDTVVSNAGMPLRAAALEVTRAQWDEVIATNLAGAFFVSQQAARYWHGAKRGGSIIHMASTHGLVALAGRSTYGISKAGMIQMTRMLAIEWAEHGIRVNAIAPGSVVTESRADLETDPVYRQAMLARVPLKRFGTVQEVAAAVCYLASPQAAYITGQVLTLDGGLTAQ